MSADAPAGVRLGKCMTCHVRFLPVDGPCPKCGSRSTEPYVSPGIGTVLASTSLEVPPPGWQRPHPLAFVEVEDGVRLLVVPEAPPPGAGEVVEVWQDGEVYRARRSARSEGERGEGDAPRVGSSRPPFEPPR